MVIQIISTLILARILTPEEIGIYSLGAVVIGFAQMIRDFGVSNYLIQEKELTQDRIRTAFGVTVIIAWTAAALLLLFSDTFAAFYDQPGVSSVISIMSISLFFIP
ncbi:MAG: oligosaccharide flippase family protein, partial [Sedimenticola sp.]|nr:oligosaccharide flippase family protein [Sedimenticola sp.]